MYYYLLFAIYKEMLCGKLTPTILLKRRGRRRRGKSSTPVLLVLNVKLIKQLNVIPAKVSYQELAAHYGKLGPPMRSYSRSASVNRQVPSVHRTAMKRTFIYRKRQLAKRIAEQSVPRNSAPVCIQHYHSLLPFQNTARTLFSQRTLSCIFILETSQYVSHASLTNLKILFYIMVIIVCYNFIYYISVRELSPNKKNTESNVIITLKCNNNTNYS